MSRDPRYVADLRRILDGRTSLSPADMAFLDRYHEHVRFHPWQMVCDCGRLESECVCRPPSLWRRLSRKRAPR